MDNNYILDLSVRPNQNVVNKFNKEMINMDLSSLGLYLPFWDVRTGNILWGSIGTTFGALLLKPNDESFDIIKKLQGDPETYVNLAQNIVNYCINHRLSALVDLYDPEFDVNFHKLASQYYHGVFIDEEIPEHLFVEMFAVMEMSGNKRMLDRMYSITGPNRLKLLKEGSTEVYDHNIFSSETASYLKTGIVPEYDVDWMGYWLNDLSDNGKSNIVVDIINNIDLDRFEKISNKLSNKTINSIMDEMVVGNIINSIDKHKILRRHLG